MGRLGDRGPTTDEDTGLVPPGPRSPVPGLRSPVPGPRSPVFPLERELRIRHTQPMRMDESSPRVYLVIIVVGAVLVGGVLAMYWGELAGLLRALQTE